jgi:predicted porin
VNRKYLTAAVAAALAFAGSKASALEIKLSGQIARALMYADDGVQKDLHHVDASDSTRFRFTGTHALTPGVTAGVLWEMEFLSNPSSKVQNRPSTARSISPTLDERHILVYFEGGFGRVGLGQSDGAANGLTEFDLSGTGIIGNMTVTDWGGDMLFRDGATGAQTTIKARDAVNNLDFESRYDRLRYDTPALGPVRLAVSTGVKSMGAGLGRVGATNFTSGGTATTASVHEVAARFAQDWGAAGKLEAGLGYSTKDAPADAGGDVETTGGSIAWLAPGGFNVALAYAKQENKAFFDGEYTGVKVGYKAGRHAVSAQYNRSQNLSDTMIAGIVTRNNDKGELTAIGYVFSPTAWAELFAGFHLFSLDRPTTRFEDIKLFSLGTRLKF